MTQSDFFLLNLSPGALPACGCLPCPAAACQGFGCAAERLTAPAAADAQMPGGCATQTTAAQSTAQQALQQEAHHQHGCIESHIAAAAKTLPTTYLSASFQRQGSARNAAITLTSVYCALLV
jgi:hypothetical protein